METRQINDEAAAPRRSQPLRRRPLIHDPVRDLLRGRIEDGSASSRELSKLCGKHHSFISAFINAGIPKYLNEAQRTAVGRSLGVDPAMLDLAAIQKANALQLAIAAATPRPAADTARGHEPPQQQALVSTMAGCESIQRERQLTPSLQELRRAPITEQRPLLAGHMVGQPMPSAIPLFMESDIIDRGRASRFAPRPNGILTDGDAVAIAVMRGCTRARPGDTIYAAERIPRPGDLIVCLDHAMRVAVIGDLTHADHSSVRIHNGATIQDYDLARYSILKVTDLMLA